MKQCIVVGLGTFGYNLALELSRQGHQVLAVDSDPAVVGEIKDRVTEAVVADVTDNGVFDDLLIPGLDTAVIGLGERSMEAIILAIVHLKKAGVKSILVKAMNDIRGEVYLSIGATEIVYPEKETAIRLARRLSIPELIDEIPLAPEYSLVEIALPDAFIGKSLHALRLNEKFGVAIVAVKDVLKDTLLLNPGRDVVLNPDSALVMIGRHVDIEKLKRFSG